MAAVRTHNPYIWLALGWAAARLAPAAVCIALFASLCASLLGLIAYNAYAYARQGDSAVLVGGKGEFYLAALPPGWGKRAEAADALGHHGGHHGDWLPEGQSLADWTDRMTLQVVPQLAGEPPRDFLDRMANLRAETCEHMFATEVESAPVNGFRAGFRIIACTRDKRTGTGEVRLLRVVTGESALYVIQRTFRVAPFAPATFPVAGDALDAARAALEYGFACRRGSTGQPCPAEWRPALDALRGDPALVVFPAEP